MEHCVVVLWRWKNEEIEFFFPGKGALLDTMSFEPGTERYTIAAQRLVKGKFGFNPRNNACVFSLAVNDFTTVAVAINLAAHEATTVEAQGTWAPIWVIALEHRFAPHAASVEWLGRLSARLQT